MKAPEVAHKKDGFSYRHYVRSQTMESSVSGATLPITRPALSVQRQCACGGGCPTCEDTLSLRSKLAIGAPDDQYEQEADRLADRVMQMPQPAPARTEPVLPLQPHKDEGRGGLIQAKATAGGSSEVDRVIAGRITAMLGGGVPLEPGIQAFMGARFGRDFSQVRVHADQRADKLARPLNALAFSYGNDLFFAQGQYRPSDRDGQHLIAHELTHTIQQTGNAQRTATGTGRVVEGPEVSRLSTGPAIQKQDKPCDDLHELDAQYSEILALEWREKVLSWLGHLDGLAVECGKTGFALPGKTATLHRQLQLVNRHFNLASYLAQDGKDFPAEPGGLSSGLVRPVREFIAQLQGRFQGLRFLVPVKCQDVCEEEGEGGHAIAGSGEFAICLDVYDCQEQDGKTYIVFHEVVHATYAEANFDVYIKDDAYPGKYPTSIRNPDSLANFAAQLNVGQEFAPQTCMGGMSITGE